MIIKDKPQCQNASGKEDRGSSHTQTSGSNVVSFSTARQRREDGQTRMKEIKILEAAAKLGW